MGTYSWTAENVTIISEGEASLNAEVGTYSVNGTDAFTLWLAGEVSAGVGTYTWTGTPVVIQKSLILEAFVGTYFLVGTESLLRAPRDYWVKDEPNPGAPVWSKAGARTATWTKQDDFLRGV